MKNSIFGSVNSIIQSTLNQENNSLIVILKIYRKDGKQDMIIVKNDNLYNLLIYNNYMDSYYNLIY